MNSTEQRDLLLAVLAMDSYNRGYGDGLIHGENQIGTATFHRESSIVETEPERAASFYAAAYTVGSEIVIAYRVGVSFLPDWPSASTQGASL